MLWNGNECAETKVMGMSRRPWPQQVVVDEKQLENVEYCSCIGKLIKYSISTAKAALNKDKALSTTKLILNLRNKPVKYYSWTLLKFVHFRKKIRSTWKVLKWDAGEGWRRSEMRNEVALQRVKEEGNILHAIKRRKANWIGHTLRRNCLPKHSIEGKKERWVEMTSRRGRRRKQLLDDPLRGRENAGNIEEALDHALWRTGCGRGCGPITRQKWMSGWMNDRGPMTVNNELE